MSQTWFDTKFIFMLQIEPETNVVVLYSGMIKKLALLEMVQLKYLRTIFIATKNVKTG